MIPDSVICIGFFAFFGCIGLSEVVIPEGVTIGNDAFGSCTGIRQLTIAEGVTIGEHAFKWCRSLNEVHIASGLNISRLRLACGEINPLVIREKLYFRIGGTATFPRFRGAMQIGFANLVLLCSERVHRMHEAGNAILSKLPPELLQYIMFFVSIDCLPEETARLDSDSLMLRENEREAVEAYNDLKGLYERFVPPKPKSL